MTTFDTLREDLLRDVADDRRAWTLTTIPPIIGVAVVSLMLSLISVYGLYLSVIAIRDAKEIVTLAKAAQVFCRRKFERSWLHCS
jgi:hypothetical protein